MKPHDPIERAAVLAITAAVALGGGRIAPAVCINESHAIVSTGKHNQAFVANAFAVPVAVPVSPFSPLYYTAAPYQQQQWTAAPKSKEEIAAERIADRAVEQIIERLGQTDGNLRALEKPTIFARTCGRCHTSEAAARAADDRPVFGRLADLNEAQRLQAIDAIVHDRMPKAGKLSPDEAGALIRELTSIPAAGSASAPPSPTQPQQEEVSHENGS